jgi:hypothetical protein
LLPIRTSVPAPFLPSYHWYKKWAETIPKLPPKPLRVIIGTGAGVAVSGFPTYRLVQPQDPPLLQPLESVFIALLIVIDAKRRHIEVVADVNHMSGSFLNNQLPNGFKEWSVKL